jgi:2-iminobutanoate/2-iminopropanoate deaminase
LISQAIHTHLAPAPRGRYSQAVRVGDFLFISGQLPLDREGRMVSGTIVEEAKQVLSNVRAIVEAAGGTTANLVQCTIYISDISHWLEVDHAYGAFFSAVTVLPARAVVAVKELHFEAHIEIQAVAVMGAPSLASETGRCSQGA